MDVVKFLQSQGHDVKIVPKGSLDGHIAVLAMQFPPRDYSGILVFRIHPPRFEKFKNVLEDFFSSYSDKKIKGKTFVVQEHSFLEIG